MISFSLHSQKIIADTTTYSMQDFQDGSFWDRNDQQYSLNKLSGKVVFIDFWATWCTPCVSALPESESLLKKIKKPQFELVFISLDRDIEKWKKFLKAKAPDGIHIRISDDKQHPIRKMLTTKYRQEGNVIEMLTIPQYYLILQNGTFKKVDAPNAKTKKQIVSLLTNEQSE